MDPESFAANNEPKFGFLGTTNEYFRIWIRGFTLSILTLGLYSPWAKYHNLRYLCSRATFDSIPFEFVGTAIAIFKVRAMYLVGILASGLCLYYFPEARVSIGILIFLVLPALLTKAIKRRANTIAYKGVRFSFDGTYWDTLYFYFVRFLLCPLTLGALFVRVDAECQQYYMRKHRYGVDRLDFVNCTSAATCRSGSFKQQWFTKLGMGTLCTLVFFTLLASIPLLFLKDVGKFFGTAWLAVPLALALLLLHFKNTRETLNRTICGKYRLHSSLSAKRYVWLCVSNGIAILVTFGLAIPWATVRRARVHAQSLVLLATGMLDQAAAAHAEPNDLVGQPDANESAPTTTEEFFELDMRGPKLAVLGVSSGIFFLWLATQVATSLPDPSNPPTSTTVPFYAIFIVAVGALLVSLTKPVRPRLAFRLDRRGISKISLQGKATMIAWGNIFDIERRAKGDSSITVIRSKHIPRVSGLLSKRILRATFPSRTLAIHDGISSKTGALLMDRVWDWYQKWAVHSPRDARIVLQVREGIFGTVEDTRTPADSGHTASSGDVFKNTQGIAKYLEVGPFSERLLQFRTLDPQLRFITIAVLGQMIATLVIVALPKIGDSLPFKFSWLGFLWVPWPYLLICLICSAFAVSLAMAGLLNTSRQGQKYLFWSFWVPVVLVLGFGGLSMFKELGKSGLTHPGIDEVLQLAQRVSMLDQTIFVLFLLVLPVVSFSLFKFWLLRASGSLARVAWPRRRIFFALGIIVYGLGIVGLDRLEDALTLRWPTLDTDFLPWLLFLVPVIQYFALTIFVKKYPTVSKTYLFFPMGSVVTMAVHFVVAMITNATAAESHGTGDGVTSAYSIWAVAIWVVAWSMAPAFLLLGRALAPKLSNSLPSNERQIFWWRLLGLVALTALLSLDVPFFVEMSILACCVVALGLLVLVGVDWAEVMDWVARYIGQKIHANHRDDWTVPVIIVSVISICWHITNTRGQPLVLVYNLFELTVVLGLLALVTAVLFRIADYDGNWTPHFSWGEMALSFILFGLVSATMGAGTDESKIMLVATSLFLCLACKGRYRHLASITVFWIVVSMVDIVYHVAPGRQSVILSNEMFDVRMTRLRDNLGWCMAATSVASMVYVAWSIVRHVEAKLKNVLVRLIFTLNLSLLLLYALVAVIFHSAEHFGHNSPLIAAFVVFLALCWDIFTSGHSMTNIHSSVFPRRSRVYLFFAYISAVVCTICFSSAVDKPALSVVEISSLRDMVASNATFTLLIEAMRSPEVMVRVGIEKLGVPLVLTLFALRFTKSLKSAPK